MRVSEELMARLHRLAEAEKVELLAVEIGGPARKMLVRLVLDRQPEGITLDDCERMSRQASVLLDAYDPFPGSYTLEVSSPGLDRKLYGASDYERYAGEAVQVRMKPGWTGPRKLVGILVGRAGGAVTIRDAEGTEHALPEAEVFETRLDPRYDDASPSRKGRKGTKR